MTRIVSIAFDLLGVSPDYNQPVNVCRSTFFLRHEMQALHTRESDLLDEDSIASAPGKYLKDHSGKRGNRRSRFGHKAYLRGYCHSYLISRDASLFHHGKDESVFRQSASSTVYFECGYSGNRSLQLIF